MNKFKYQLVLEGEVDAPNKDAVTLWVLAGVSPNLSVGNTIQGMTVNVEPVTTIEVVPGGLSLSRTH